MMFSKTGFLILLLQVSTLSAEMLSAEPVLKTAPCPAGYSTSGGYCHPGKSARFASKSAAAAHPDIPLAAVFVSPENRLDALITVSAVVRRECNEAGLIVYHAGSGV